MPALRPEPGRAASLPTCGGNQMEALAFPKALCGEPLPSGPGQDVSSKRLQETDSEKQLQRQVTRQ